MFFFRRPPSAPYEIYSSSLDALYLGHALWYPEPHVTGEPQIGDVGFVRRGAFVRLFNLDTSAPEKKVTFKWLKPFEGMEPLPPGVLQVDSRSGPLVPKHYCSHGVEAKEIHTSVDATAGAGASAGVNVEYACKAAQGAVLVLQSEAYEETLFENHALKTFIVRNHDIWYGYAKGDLSQDVEQEDIVFVSGWVKTTADWATSAFSNTSTRFGASLRARIGGVAGIDAGGSHTRTVTGPRMERRGKSHSVKTSDSAKTGESKDQSVFVKRLMVRKRPMLPRKIVAGAGYHPLSDPEDGRSGSGGEGIMAREGDMDETNVIQLGDESRIPDPLDILLDYILETSGVKVAIAGDDDVQSIVGGKQVVDFASYLRRVQPPVYIDGTLGSLCMEDVICNEQERAVARRTITKSDMAKWPYITTDSAGRLDGGLVFVGPTEAEARPLKLKHFIFADSQDPSSRFKRYALSDDGELLAASFDNGGILIWRLSDGLLVQRLQHQDHTGDVESLSFSPNSQSLVSGSEDKSATVWDPRSGHVLLRLEHTETVTKVAYAPHGALIATASGDRSIKIWDAWTGACVQSFDADEIIYKLAFSPDGLRFYAEAGLGVRVYDVRTYTPIARLQDRMGSDSSWSISCQGDYIVTASYGQVKIWSAVTGEEILAISHPQELSSPAAFSPDGAEVLASCGADKTAVTFDSRTGQLRRIFKLSDRARWAAYSPDGDYVVLGDSGGELKAFDTKSGSFLARLETGGGIFDVQFVPDSKHLLIDFEDKPPILCNIYDVMRMR